MSPELLIGAGAGVVLLIACLVMRESTEVRLARMRTALMSLRNQERGLEKQIEEMQKTKSQINEAMSRAQGRQSSIENLLEPVYADLGKLYEHLRDEKLTGPPGSESDEEYEDDNDEE